MRLKFIITLLLTFQLMSGVHANDEKSNKVYNIERIPSQPEIDGNWNDVVWQGLPIATDFVQLRSIENGVFLHLRRRLNLLMTMVHYI